MKRLLIVSLLLSVAIVSQANAGVVTFDDAYANSIVNTYFTNTQSFSDQGLTFTNQGTFSGIWANNPNGNGTNSGIFAGFATGDYLAITKTGGGAFDVISFDMSISWYDSNPTETIFINGAPIILIQGIQTYTLNLNSITELDITGVPSDTGYWLIDNVNYNTATGVPEPATMLLLGTGLVVLWGARRKPKK